MQRAVLLCPRNLEVSHRETSQSASPIDQRRDLSLSRIRVRGATLSPIFSLSPVAWGSNHCSRRLKAGIEDQWKNREACSKEDSQTATVQIMFETIAIPHPITSAPTFRVSWSAAPMTTKPHMYNGIDTYMVLERDQKRRHAMIVRHTTVAFRPRKHPCSAECRSSSPSR